VVGGQRRDPAIARLAPRRVAAWIGRQLARAGRRFSPVHAALQLPRRLRYRRVIEQMHLAVCTPCQYDCVSCAHQAIRYEHSNYHLPLSELKEFLAVTESSGYFIERILISGPGEPLMWKHLHEGLALLAASPVIGYIEVLSNGLAINRLDDRAWRHIDRLRVSWYPEAAHLESELLEAQRRYGASRVVVNAIDKFRAPPAGPSGAIPCECMSTGPTYFDGRVLLFCGPPVFDAARLAGRDVFDYADIFRTLRPGYLEPDKPDQAPTWLAPVDPIRKTGNHELCRTCWANQSTPRPRHDHVAFTAADSAR